MLRGPFCLRMVISFDSKLMVDILICLRIRINPEESSTGAAPWTGGVGRPAPSLQNGDLPSEFTRLLKIFTFSRRNMFKVFEFCEVAT